MGIIGWIVVGLIAGLIAKAIVPGSAPGGIILTILLGIAGALVGGFLAVALGFGTDTQSFDLRTIFIAVLGAVLILVIYSMVSGRKGLRI
jgi:uncharacterized membrane protein YeaQ/YmgE (transglycosylase-associated protein family)